jgi:8-oxo-dGTP diphosphatase
VPQGAVGWSRAFNEDGVTKWFFVARLPERVADEVILGDEGQRWELMTEEVFLDHPKAVPAFQARLRIYLDERDRGR